MFTIAGGQLPHDTNISTQTIFDLTGHRLSNNTYNKQSSSRKRRGCKKAKKKRQKTDIAEINSHVWA